MKPFCMVFGITKLIGGAKVNINHTPDKCKCGAEMYWALTQSKKMMPVSFNFKENGWQSHFADCPLANKFRK